MELMKCPKCGQPLVCELSVFETYVVSADGAHLVSIFSSPQLQSVDRHRVICPTCKQEYPDIVNPNAFSWGVPGKGETFYID